MHAHASLHNSLSTTRSFVLLTLTHSLDISLGQWMYRTNPCRDEYVLRVIGGFMVDTLDDKVPKPGSDYPIIFTRA